MLIGSGSNCQLQLGGGMPMAHSVIAESPSGWAIEALQPEPPLLVDGQRVRQSALVDGSAVQIGPFQFVLHLPAVAAQELLAPVPVAETVALAAQPAWTETLDSLPAEELLDGLVTDLTSAVLLARGAEGVRGLIDAAADADEVAIDEESLIAEVMAQLASMSSELSARGIPVDAESADVLALPSRDEVPPASPLRKSA